MVSPSFAGATRARVEALKRSPWRFLNPSFAGVVSEK
jgi:hypothetical protein